MDLGALPIGEYSGPEKLPRMRRVETLCSVMVTEAGAPSVAA